MKWEKKSININYIWFKKNFYNAIFKKKDVFDLNEILKINIILIFLAKIINTAIQFILVPIILELLTPINYGIWITINSITVWFTYLDGGVENGLRNKLIQSIKKENFEEAKKLISLAYFTLTSISLIFLLVFYFLDKYSILQLFFQINGKDIDTISQVFFISFAFFIINFIMRVFNAVQNANNLAYKNEIYLMIGNILTLFFIFVLKFLKISNFPLFAFVINISNVLVFLIASVVGFNTRFKNIRPSFYSLDFSNIKSFFNLSTNFFLMQIASLILFTTDNVIISRLFDVVEVSKYNIALKYFTIINLIFTMISAPLSSSYGHAFNSNDFIWIKSILKKMIKLWIIMNLLILVFIFGGTLFFDIWLNKRLNIPKELIIVMGIYTSVLNWNTIFSSFVNATSKIKLSTYSAIFNSIINIPLSIILADYFQLGSKGVIIATIICLLIGAILRPIQAIKILNNKAVGIWNK